MIQHPSHGWRLDAMLERDTMTIGDMPLSRVLLINDANYPWLLLVPRRPDIKEIADLGADEQVQLIGEIANTSRALKEITRCDKINVAALGNVVPQLHVHVIARTRGDAAWPRPVWNAVPPKAYGEMALLQLLTPLRPRLSLLPS
jgi:diadenosine tetraphosphate (Ap4A) HIT family hydrolase